MFFHLSSFFFFFFFFFFNDTATTEIYTSSHTLSLHDALPIFSRTRRTRRCVCWFSRIRRRRGGDRKSTRLNSSHVSYLVCRLLLEKKKKITSKKAKEVNIKKTKKSKYRNNLI